MDGTELEQLLFQHLPERFFRAAVHSVFTARRMAWDHCKAHFQPPEAQNLRPYYGRGALEGLLRDTALRFPGIEAVAVKDPKSNWNHTEIHGGSAVLTASTVQTPCGLVEKADFRLTLAHSDQQTLFGDDEQPAVSRLYVLLLHSTSRWDTRDDQQKYGHLPGSIYLAFPASDLDVYLHDINLMERYPDIVESYLPKEWDKQAQVRYLYRARKVASL